VGCAGPDPRIEHVDIVASRRSGTVRVALVVVNRSAGHGQVQIKIRLHSNDGAHTLAAERALDIDSHQRLDVTMDIPAPDADYVAEASVVYPD
jgi:hypothetical protein